MCSCHLAFPFPYLTLLSSPSINLLPFNNRRSEEISSYRSLSVPVPPHWHPHSSLRSRFEPQPRGSVRDPANKLCSKLPFRRGEQGSGSEKMKRKTRNKIIVWTLALAAAAILVGGTIALVLTAGTWKAQIKKAQEKICNKGWECSGSKYCCNDTITDFFKVYQFENLFAKRNTPVAHAVGFWDYQAFITAAALFEPQGFCTTGGKKMQMMELCAFLGHVGAKTSCGYGVATGGPTAWGLCYNHEMSPDQTYCDKTYTQYPCVEGAEYYGRGAIPVYWNYNYGAAGDGIKADLLHHPEYLEQNATLAFMAAMWRWMTPIKKSQPSAHEAFVGTWKPTKNDTLSKRLPGFGATMNLLYGESICGKGYVDAMNTIISHYQFYLDLMGVGREQSGDNRDCAEQAPFNPSSPTDDQKQQQSGS